MTAISSIGHFLDTADFTDLHTALALFGGLLAIYVMQKTRYEAEDQRDPPALRSARTIALVALAGSLFWSLTYRDSHDWHPAPPFLLGMLALDVLLAVRAVAIWARIKRTGRYWNAPSMGYRRTGDRRPGNQ